VIRAIEADIPVSPLDMVGIASKINRVKSAYMRGTDRTCKGFGFNALRAVSGTERTKSDFPVLIFQGWRGVEIITRIHQLPPIVMTQKCTRCIRPHKKDAMCKILDEFFDPQSQNCGGSRQCLLLTDCVEEVALLAGSGGNGASVEGSA